MRRLRARLLGLGLVAAVVVLVGLLRFGSALTLALVLAAPGAGAWLAPLLETPAREDVVVPGARGPLRADLYRPARPRGALLLVHGLSRAGRRQPDLERLARALAAHRLLVVVPQFEGLAAFRLAGSEVDDVRAALRHTATLHRVAGVAGFSFGAGPALLAAADVPGLATVGSFGGYADLRDVIRFITTGVHAFAGRRYVQRSEDYNRWKLLALLTSFVADTDDRRLLEALAEQRLAGSPADTSDLERGLGPAGRTVLALVVNRREEAVDALLGRLPVEARDALERLSPLRAVPRLSGRLLVAHGTWDESIPFTESLRLTAAAEQRAHLTLFETFHHTGPGRRSARDRIRDGWRLVGLVDDLLP